MCARLQSYPDMIEPIARLKARLPPKVVVANNQGCELNYHRVYIFGLDGFVGFVASSASCLCVSRIWISTDWP